MQALEEVCDGSVLCHHAATKNSSGIVALTYKTHTSQYMCV